MSDTAVRPSLPALTMRHGSIEDLLTLLKTQRAQMIDVTAPVAAMRFEGGRMLIGGLPVHMSEQGVTDPSGAYRLTDGAVTDLSERLFSGQRAGTVLRTLHDVDVPTFDSLLNQRAAFESFVGKNLLLRLMYGTDDADPASVGFVRAVLSDRYGLNRDNLDVATGFLRGCLAAGLTISDIRNIDLAGGRLYIDVVSPDIEIAAAELLAGYRSPYRGPNESSPMVRAGLTLLNDELGGGARVVRPFVHALACSNGMVVKVAADRANHVGGRLEEGAVIYGADTVEADRNAEILAVRDIVLDLLSEKQLRANVDILTGKAVAAVTSEPVETMQAIGKALRFSNDEVNLLLGDLMRSGQELPDGKGHLAGAYLQAATSASQRISDPARAREIQEAGVLVMETATAYAASK